MRTCLLPTTLLFALSTALQSPSYPDLQPFLAALSLSNATSIPTPTTPPGLHELLKRQATVSSSDTCPTSYIDCANLGAPNLCCDNNAVCSADFAGHVACCRKGAACSGTISNVITAGTVSNGVLLAGGAAGATTDANGGLVTASATTTTAYGAVSSTTADSNGLVVATSTVGTTAQGSGFVLDGTSTVATPGSGMRRAEVPFLAQAILKALQYLPV